MKIEALGIAVKSSSNKILYVYFPYIKFGEKESLKDKPKSSKNYIEIS